MILYVDRNSGMSTLIISILLFILGREVVSLLKTGKVRNVISLYLPVPAVLMYLLYHVSIYSLNHTRSATLKEVEVALLFAGMAVVCTAAPLVLLWVLLRRR